MHLADADVELMANFRDRKLHERQETYITKF